MVADWVSRWWTLNLFKEIESNMEFWEIMWRLVCDHHVIEMCANPLIPLILLVFADVTLRMKCLKCNHLSLEKAPKFCSECGYKLSSESCDTAPGRCLRLHTSHFFLSFISYNELLPYFEWLFMHIFINTFLFLLN